MVTQHELRMASAEPRNKDAQRSDDTEKKEIPSISYYLPLFIDLLSSRECPSLQVWN